MRISDWSSEVCSSDLDHLAAHQEFRQCDGAGKAQQADDERGFIIKCAASLNSEGDEQEHYVDVERVEPQHAILRTRAPHQPQDRAGHRSEEHTSELQSLMRIS